MQPLTISLLKEEAAAFAERESAHKEPALYGVTDGKAIGTYLEKKFRDLLAGKYTMQLGNTAKGIDFPGIGVDLKATRITQPQSSCPFRSARQKVFGLGYHLLIFVYDKTDDPKNRTANLNILHTLFIERECTADFTLTRRLREMVDDGGNHEDIVAYLYDRNLPVDDIEARRIADEILVTPPNQGYLTISNALQWRLQYSRAVQVADRVAGVFDLSR